MMILGMILRIKRDGSGQAYAVQNTGPGGDNLAQMPGPMPLTSTALGVVGQQIAPT